MPAPLAKGLIIAASVLVAAGIAIYESPQVRQWVDHSRRKIAVALHSLGDEIQPQRSSSHRSDNGEQETRRRRESIIQRNRSELIRRAREEGIAVDLDELARIGRGTTEDKTSRHHGSDRSWSFDDIVGSDGMLKEKRKAQDTTATTATAMESTDGEFRRRGRAMQGFNMGSSAANPFADEATFDRDLIGPEDHEAPSPNPFIFAESRESTDTLPGDHLTSQNVSGPSPLIDLSTEDPPISLPHLSAEPAQTTSIYFPTSPTYSEHNHSSTQDQDQDQATQSFYSFTSSQSDSSHHPHNIKDEESLEILSTGTLTPRSDGFSTAASLIGSQASDIAVLSMQDDLDHDARSEIFSEGGFTEAGFSEAGFSDLDEEERERRLLGAHTPSEWTDVGSESGSEFGGPGGMQGSAR